jgi:hypothetical protein
MHPAKISLRSASGSGGSAAGDQSFSAWYTTVFTLSPKSQVVVGQMFRMKIHAIRDFGSIQKWDANIPAQSYVPARTGVTASLFSV